MVIATAVSMATTFSLGRWQLSRAAEKEALQLEITARAQLPDLDVQVLSQPHAPEKWPDFWHRGVSLRGVWLPQHAVYLDNRQMNGRQGFEVLAPLQLTGSGAVVLVRRGWAPRNFTDRRALPPVQTPEGEVHIQGRIAPSPPRLYSLGEETRDVIRQNLDLDAFRIETALPLLPVSVLQTGPASEGLSREWAEPKTGVEKHYGYAFQWLGLCALIGMLFLGFQVVKPIYLSRRD